MASLRSIFALLLAFIAAGPALADVRVHYEDAYPDVITITNRSGCDLGPFELVIDLGASPAGLIFDVTGAGAGSSGYAAVQIVGGKEQVLGISNVTDGDSKLVLKLDYLGGGGTVTLHVDVDDTKPNELGRTYVDGSEIAGAVVTTRLIAGGKAQSGTFGTDGVALVGLEACIS